MKGVESVSGSWWRVADGEVHSRYQLARYEARSDDKVVDPSFQQVCSVSTLPLRNVLFQVLGFQPYMNKGSLLGIQRCRRRAAAQKACLKQRLRRTFAGRSNVFEEG
jgi:hypothetical protein